MRRSISLAALVAVTIPLFAAPPAKAAREKCLRPMTTNPCFVALNETRGTAFLFATRRGTLGGRITVAGGGPNRRPFTTNATGVATGLNADRLDGLSAEDIFRISREGVIALIRQNFDPNAFLRATGKAADSNLLDGLDATAFLPVRGKAADAELLDGKKSSAFLGAAAKATDADRLDGKDSNEFLGVAAKAADADELDGLDSTELFPNSRALKVIGNGRREMNIGDNGPLLSEYGLDISMYCVDVGGGVPGIQLELETDENNTFVFAEGGGVNGGVHVVNDAGSATFLEIDQNDAGQLATVDLTVTKPNGVDITGTLGVGFQLHNNDCMVSGTLLKTP